METIKFFTVGCKVNQYDTQSIREAFIQAGFKELEDSRAADVYIINTCTVTHKADSDSLRLMHKARRENPKAKIIVTGCLAELDADKIKKIDDASVIIKNKDKENILGYLSRHDETCKATENTHRGISYFKGHTRAFLKIQDGCNNFCSYCKVPLVRGRSRSKPIDEIIQEAKNLVKNDFREIVLCGICLGAYGKDLFPPISLVRVIAALEEIEGLMRIRLSSIEAGDVTDELIDRMSQSLPDRQAGKKLCPHLHIPIQSGDDKILKRMNRKYCRDDYLNLIRKLKRQIPQIAITTDVLVGFPAEDESNFQNTLDLVKEISPLKVHIFPYSKRGWTSAADNLKDEVKSDIIKKRALRLKGLADACALKYKKQFLNKNMPVLIECRSKDKPDSWEGYTDNYLKVLIKSNLELKNQLIPLKLKEIDRDFVLAYFH